MKVFQFIQIFALCLLIAPAHAQTNPAAELLRELIRIDTSNPPGNEGALAEFLRPKFEDLGFEVTIVETPAEGKAHFIARLRGDGSKRPILLAAHADVVGVEPDLWTQEPFAGDIVDGYVYGRGAIDFKGGLAVFAEAVMQLARNDVPLARDVIFLAEADEEGGSYGTGWLAQDHWHLIDAEFALNEGGWIIKRPNSEGRSDDVRYVSISTADKFMLSLRITASGHSIHSSMPRPDNAIFALAKALDRLSEYDGGVQFIPITRQFFETLALTAEEPEKTWLEDFIAGTDAARAAQADRQIGVDPLLRAFTRNTIAPVILEAGFRINVIPGTATALVNFRLIPGTDVAAFIEEIRRVTADPAISVEILTSDSQEAALAGLQERSRQLPSPEDTELYQALAASAREQYPEALVTSYLFQAGTDAGAWRNRGVPVYGIYPYPIDQDDLSRMHGNDERVPVQSLAEGTEMIYRVLVDVAAAD
ncbi:MAG: M20/M25/M40 family metallo-hydrolase [Gammaproteobacteria bacterium]|nr:M20/M25/M40 family metallo-hydrolase [Gammaproteobacteria bacterium]MYE28780.1 M20/M25/M40 family metallo-hydrolase [Gammaproteobacteria bacterium]